MAIFGIETEVLAAVALIAFLTHMYRYNDKRAVDETAKEGEYSHASSYVNISAMKHDFFKQICVDVVLPFLVLCLPFLVSGETPIVTLPEVFDLSSFRSFANSIAGKSVLTTLGYAFFYQLVQPYWLNKTPFY